jgi:N utilization substance protein A
LEEKTSMNVKKGMNEDFFEAIEELESKNGISAEFLIDKIKQGILKAMKKEYPGCDNINIEIDPAAKIFDISVMKTVVEGEPENPNEINIDEARNIDPRSSIGGVCEIKVSPAIFGRVAAGTAKQSIHHDIKEFENKTLLESYKNKEHEIVSATVVRIEPVSGHATLMVDKNEVYLFRNEQIPGEVLKEGDIIKVYVVGIVNPEKKPMLKVSRTHKDLVKRLFELEVPEVYDGTVEIKAISREAGSRTKIAVWSKDKNVDAVGACIGPKRSRISKIVAELGGEKIDIIPYSENPEEFVASALAPAEVVSVKAAEDGSKSCTVIVPNSQLSLAIGNKGQNAKLAARLTGYKIDIKPSVGHENAGGAETSEENPSEDAPNE